MTEPGGPRDSGGAVGVGGGLLPAAGAGRHALGLAAGVIYYPLFLLPLWCSFYWRRGLVRFVVGVAVVLLLLTASLAFTSDSFAAFSASAADVRLDQPVAGQRERILADSTARPTAFP